MAAGADLSKVEIVVGTMIEMKQKNKPRVKRRTNLDLKRDCKHLLEALKKNPDIALLVLDPISSFFGAGADQNKDADVRPVMDEITKMCSKSGLTVVGIIHYNKRSDVDAVGKVKVERLHWPHRFVPYGGSARMLEGQEPLSHEPCQRESFRG